MSGNLGFIRVGILVCLLLFIATSLASPLLAQTFVQGPAQASEPVSRQLDEIIVRDVQVTWNHPEIESIYDPEFDLATGLVTWQDVGPGPGTRLWVARVNEDGNFEGILELDTGLTALSDFRNGPEWVYGGNHDPIIVYCKGTQEHVTMAWAYPVGPNPWNWTAEEILLSEDYFGPVGNMDTDGLGDPRILYGKAIYDNEIDRNVIETIPYWSTLEGTLNPVELPPEFELNNLDVGLGRWVQNWHGIITTVPEGPNNNRDVFTWDMDENHDPVQRTDTPNIREGDAFMWKDPSVADRFWFFTTIEDANAAEIQSRGLNIYRVDGDVVTLSRTILPPNGVYSYVISPEPMIVGNQSFVIYLVSNLPMANDNGLSQVWAAGVHPNGLNRRISNPGLEIRKDPEPFTVDGNVWVFYTQFDGPLRQVRRCSFDL